MVDLDARHFQEGTRRTGAGGVERDMGTSLFDRSIEIDMSEYVRRAQHWFGVRRTDTGAFEERLRAGFAFGAGDHYAENRIECSRHLGMFSFELFRAMICGGQSFKPVIVIIMWERLVASGVIMKTFAAMPGIVFADHQILEHVLYGHIDDDSFANLFASPARLPQRYAGAIAAVDVLKGGDIYRGTAFVVRHEGQQYLVTAKHNVDPDEDVVVEAVTSEAGARLILNPIIRSPDYDIAVAALAEPIVGPCFALSDNIDLFDEVFTLGYPLVPRANSLLLGHRGEMNGRAQLYEERCPALIISNLVSPGSSGGPVLTRDGRCVGMTINWLEGERKVQETRQEKDDDEDREEKEKACECAAAVPAASASERMRFSAALPAELLRNLIDHCSEGRAA